MKNLVGYKAGLPSGFGEEHLNIARSYFAEQLNEFQLMKAGTNRLVSLPCSSFPDSYHHCAKQPLITYILAGMRLVKSLTLAEFKQCLGENFVKIVTYKVLTIALDFVVSQLANFFGLFVFKGIKIAYWIMRMLIFIFIFHAEFSTPKDNDEWSNLRGKAAGSGLNIVRDSLTGRRRYRK